MLALETGGNAGLSAPGPHLVEHGEVHPRLQVGRDVGELVEAALLLLAHAVVECGPALRHAICNAGYETENKQSLTFFCTPRRPRCAPRGKSVNSVARAPLSPLSTRWSFRRPTRSSPMGVLWERTEGRNLADTPL